MQSFRNRIALAAAALGAAGASAQHVDVLIAVSSEAPGELRSGAVNVELGGIEIPVRVFAESVADSGADDLRGDEGFFGVTDAGALPAGASPLPEDVDVRFDFISFAIDEQSANLWFWDPLANPTPHFQPATDGMRVSFRKVPTSFFNATVDGAPVDVPGFTIDRTGAGGLLHKHLTIVVDDSDSDAGTPVPSGIYALGYRLSYPGAASELVIEVIEGGLGGAGEAALEESRRFFEDYLIPPAPCPGDLNGDGVVDITDLATQLANFGAAGAGLEDGDIDGDGDVDISDLAEMLAAFGLFCE